MEEVEHSRFEAVPVGEDRWTNGDEGDACKDKGQAQTTHGSDCQPEHCNQEEPAADLVHKADFCSTPRQRGPKAVNTVTRACEPSEMMALAGRKTSWASSVPTSIPSSKKTAAVRI